MAGFPPVKSCNVTDCFYNQEVMCHAPAINVGGAHPNCDTFIPKGQHIGRGEQGMVGACHVSQCRYNLDLTCNAQGIDVVNHETHADCGTYEPLSGA